MRRILLLLIVCAAWLPLGLYADDRPAEATARLQREEAEERYKTLNGKVESLTETLELVLKNQDKIQQKIHALGGEIDEVKRSQVRAAAGYATQDQLKELVRDLNEIDKKRTGDNERVLGILKDIQKMPIVTPPPVAEKPSVPVRQDAWDYVVKTNDTLKKIVIGYNNAPETRGLTKLTVADVLRANPGLNQDKLLVGKRILIPIPPKKDDKAGKSKSTNQ